MDKFTESLQPTARVSFLRETLCEIAANLGVQEPYLLTNPELKAAIYNRSCNLAPTRVVSEA